MKTTIQRTVMTGVTVLVAAFSPLPLHEIRQQNAFIQEPPGILQSIALAQWDTLLPIASPNPPERVVSRVRVVVTAYSSTPEQTDDTPFITAAGTRVREGIVAANFLPMGTKIKLPDLYGDKVFVVEDRMHPRKHYMVDIWFASYWEAKEFGAKNTYIEVLSG